MPAFACQVQHHDLRGRGEHRARRGLRVPGGGRDLGRPGSIPSAEGGLAAPVRQCGRTKGRESRRARTMALQCGGFVAGSLWETNFWTMRRLRGRQLKPPSGTIGKRPFWAKSWPGSLLESKFGNLATSRPASKSAVWAYWETASLGPNPGRGTCWSQILAMWRRPGRN